MESPVATTPAAGVKSAKRFGALRILSANAIENGAFCHFTVPEDMPNGGVLMYLDPVNKQHPVGAMVRSSDSKFFRSKGFSLQTKAMSAAKRAKANEQDRVIQDQMEMERPRRFAALVVCLRNPSVEEKGDIVLDEEELADMGNDGEFQWMVNQVMAFAFNAANFGGDEGNAAGAGENPSESPTP